jgi:hypothetical protein
VIPYRIRFERFPGKRPLCMRRGGRATQWPWWELALPRWGSLIVGRRRPRPPRAAKR